MPKNKQTPPKAPKGLETARLGPAKPGGGPRTGVK